VTDTAPEKPHRCLSHLHWFARDRDLAWEHARLAVQNLGGTDSAELAMTRLRTLLLYSPDWRTGQPFCRLRRLPT
jgi:hypothetical protein